MKLRILFVDDETKMLTSLRRMLYHMRNEWKMDFAESGPVALAKMKDEPFDVIVTDMRMPEMNGDQLLAEIKKGYPHVVRIVLSGHSDKAMIFKSVRSAHQYLAKPCDADLLTSTVNRALTLRKLLEQESLKRVLGDVDSLPSLPSLYGEIMSELQQEDCSLQKIGEIIARDLGMTTKILQLVNSAFFGIPRHIENPAQAVNLLGLNIVKALALTVEVFSQFDQTQNGFDIEALWNHSFQTGELVKRIAREEGADKQSVDDAFMAGLLHDVGKLILVDQCPEQYQAVMASVANDGIALHEAESQVLGASHAEVGAFLLGLWGMADPIVEAVAFHHNPQGCPVRSFNPLAAVHAADALGHAASGSGRQHTDHLCGLDTAFLAGIEKEDRVAVWQGIYDRMVGEEKADE